MFKNIISYYTDKFSNRIFVIKISGKIIADPTALTQICEDIKEMHERKINIIIIHGGGVQADEMSHKLGLEIKKHEGRRITDIQQIQVAQMMYGGLVNLSVMAALKKLGLQSARAGVDGNVFEVIKRPMKSIDYGHVGDITGVNTGFIQNLITQKIIPVIPSLAMSDKGEILNVNADTLALEIATNIKAEKLVFFSDVDGVKNNEKLISVLTPDISKKLIQQEVITGGMKIKVQNCLQAIEQGIHRIHILNGFKSHTLHEEIFSKEGIGTMIVSEKEAYIYNQELT